VACGAVNVTRFHVVPGKWLLLLRKQVWHEALSPAYTLLLIRAVEAALADEGRGDAEWEKGILVDSPLVFELRCVSRRVE
jgi:hypothetical protein